MPVLDSDHNHYAANHHPHSSPPYRAATLSDEPAHFSNTSPAITHLPSSAYTTPTRKRPSLSSPSDRTTPSSNPNGLAPLSLEDDEPDPHDFYRIHSDPFAAGLMAGLGQGDIRVEKRADRGLNHHHHHPPPHQDRSAGQSYRSNSPRVPQVASRINNVRYPSSSATQADRTALSATRSSPTLTSTTQKRQTSVRELANRFNETTDEVPPVPKKSLSRSTSTSSNAASQTSKSRASSRSKKVDDATSSKKGFTPGELSLMKPQRSPKARPHGGRAQEEGHVVSPRSKAHQKSHYTGVNHTQPLASQSMVDLGPEIEALSRKPLFGEVLQPGVKEPVTGYGISASRRRGSEGSMHNPNPMFSDPGNRLAVDGGEAVQDYNDGIAYGPEKRYSSHRRTLSANTAVPPQLASSNIHLNDIFIPSSSTSPEDSRRNSHSRIPVSSRRLSAVSDSGNSTTSSRNASAPGMANMSSPSRATPSKSRAPPPKPLYNARSPPPNSRSNTPQKSPRRGDQISNAQNSATSPRLKAYISAPMPKKSPPLRSSRPRQPVSSASTSASRARAIERNPTNDYFGPPQRREHKHRKPPELEGVDIAARRQAIQRSYTKKVGERERKVEEENRRKASMMKDEGMASKPPIPDELPQNNTDDLRHESVENDGTFVKDNQSHNADGVSKPERELTINTAQLSERSVLDLSMEDSPTLGTFTRFHAYPPRHGHPSSQSDLEPSSAITAGTSDSLDTFFDDEPQDDSPDNSRRPSQNRLALSQLIDSEPSRTPSPRTLPLNVNTEKSSERDDQESIQIMLGDTPILDKGPFRSTGPAGGARDPSTQEDPNYRWSATSHSSSDKSRDDKPTNSEPEAPAHLSISTASSDLNHSPWSPTSFASPKTMRTTMDSDTYSTINRVLDHYHDPNAMSPDTMQDAQHMIQSPVLARQGGWDPKKVTQLYMQQVMAERHAQSIPQPAPDLSRPQIGRRTSSLAAPPKVAEKEVRDDLDEKIVQRFEQPRNESLSSQNLQPDEGDLKPARASLNRPEDWSMSPSLIEYHQQALDSPATEERPILPPKDYGRENSIETTNRKGPILPEIQRHDLGIVVEPPSTPSSQTIAPPQPPTSPPPPPSSTSPERQTSQSGPSRSPPSPSERSKNTTSVAYSNRDSDVDGVALSIMSSDSQRPPLTLPTTVRQSNSSMISQETGNADGLSGTTEAASKASSPSPEQRRLTKRNHIIKELVDTEHSFCQDMKVVDDIYKGTSNVIIISAEDVKTLFSNSDQIVAFSTNFLDALKQGSKSVYTLAKSKRWRSNRISSNTTYSGMTDDQSSISGPELSEDDKDRKTFIGETFGNHMTEMEKVYSEYLKNHDAANQKLQALQKNPKVQIWLKECRAYAHDLTAAWDLDSLLVKPVQRILKYPLLLDQLLEVTPENHPDYTALDIAMREMKGISMRINEMKKRADLLEQVTNSNRKRKESDARIGFPKAFGRRTEKLRQQVGLSDMVEDKAYAAVREKFGTHFFQIQVVMRDVEMYTNDIQVFMNRFCEFALAMEAHIDVAQTSYPEVESKWRKFRMSTRELSTTALTDHITAVRKHVIEPLVTLWNLHAGPQKLMDKRNKRLMDYARFKAIKDRGDKPDKKVVENAELFMAVNDSLKDELPKLFEKTGRLVEACLNNFIQLQVQWQRIWRRKLSQALDDAQVPRTPKDIMDAFTSDFAFFEAQVVSLSICNGSMVNETPNLLSTTTTLNEEEVLSPRQTASVDSKRRTMSVSSDKSPQLPQPDFGGRSTGSFFTDAVQLTPGLQREPSRRMRASSTLSGHSPRTPDIPGAYRTYSNSTTPVNPTPGRLPNATPRNTTEPSASLGSSMDTPKLNRLSDDSALASNRTSGVTSYSNAPARSGSPSNRFSGVFSSAMPMSDSPPTQSPVTTPSQRPDYNVIFLAASVYEFNIDRARKEAGYPYLTYVAGEIFDVIGEKGELWLAKNQDDASSMVGWIWNKHFVKLAS